MKHENNMNPTADFFDFEMYNVGNDQKIILEPDATKSIVVLLHQAKKEELELLGKIFQAVGKNILSDAYVINEKEVPSFKTIVQAVEFNKLLVFGLAPQQIGLHVSIGAYQLLHFQNKQILFSHGLTTIATDLNHKKQLWAQLQAMFQ